MPALGLFRAGADKRINAYLYSPNGRLGKELDNKARRVRDAAKRQVGVRSGRLKRSIRVYRHNRTAFGQTLRIGTAVPYAYYHHEGTRPHTIYPDKKQVLKFRSGQAIVFTRKAHHPGTKPNRFLKDNIKYMYMP
jgi:phage gpG-like protein